VDSALARLLDYPDGPPELCARYVADFDLCGPTSLNLTYHRFGDSRRRGRALIALKRLLREAGWELAHWELPDYLPLLLELAAVDPDVGLPLLAEYRVEINAIRSALQERRSPWAAALERICEELPPPDETELARLLDEGPPTELVGLEEVRA
jgi:nitrate reductase delta subunit